MSQGLADNLRLVLILGAARHDADVGQLTHLRQELPPAMEQYAAMRVQSDYIRCLIQDIMGPEWKPTGAWATAIERMR